jgi:hypothetical protein
VTTADELVPSRAALGATSGAALALCGEAAASEFTFGIASAADGTPADTGSERARTDVSNMRARRIDTPKLGGIRRAPSNTGEGREIYIVQSRP